MQIEFELILLGLLGLDGARVRIKLKIAIDGQPIQFNTTRVGGETTVTSETATFNATGMGIDVEVGGGVIEANDAGCGVDLQLVGRQMVRFETA